MSLVIRATQEHAEKEIAEARAKRAALLEKVAELGREIATLETFAMMAVEHAAAEGNSNSTQEPA